MNITELIKRAHENAVNRDFYKCESCLGLGYTQELHADICPDCNGSGQDVKFNVYRDLNKEIDEFYNSEKSDLFNKDSEQSELADIILIILAYCGEEKIDIEKAVIDKMKYNETREYKHGKNY